MTVKQIKKLEAISAVEDIKSLKIVESYEDSHSNSLSSYKAIVEINGIKVPINLFEELGFALYFKESPSAFATLKKAIELAIEEENDNNT